jgi:integrase/recombinase XerD
MTIRKIGLETARPIQGRNHWGVFASYAKHLGRRNLSPRTLEMYAECLRAFGRYLEEHGGQNPLRASAETLADFQVWLSQEESRWGRRFSLAYRATHITVVRMFYLWLHRERRILVNPAEEIRPPKLPKQLPRDVLNAEEVRALIEQPNDSLRGLRDRVALRLMVLSGPRVNELVDLDVDDVSLEAREVLIRLGKGRKDRLTFMDRGTREHLARYLAESRPFLAKDGEQALLVSNRGRRMSAFLLRGLVRQHARAAGLARRLGCHSLRRSFCTNLLRHGANLKAIAELVGHAYLGTTARYTRVEIGELTAVYRSAHPRCGGQRP